MAATQRRKALSRYLPLALLSLPLACVGVVDGDRSQPGAPGGPPGVSGGPPGVPCPGGTSGPGGTPGPGGAAACTPNVGPSVVRRLTHIEYNNAVAELLGDK